ncbi:MAG: glycerate kinase [Synergistaceae bacterium]|jgi:hydroxypyruvate reductase|nr:glycerate kinase [Synergistaceae bacterium]MDD2350871.1 glycerate kinase [Synergistaceae bacterium]MDD3318668.1 glycerate kinase [Synergistaceae bacterium]MDD3672911.1 glycerate kinase [Synergistaceae bacterium]MDD3963376.1 glycerate kinase [Synergistaceae bacterium]
MLGHIRRDAAEIFREALLEMLPDRAVKRSLANARLRDEIILIGIGKASWTMAKAATEVLDQRIVSGAIVTKYGHSEGSLPGIKIFEAGHPLPDSNTLKATEKILEITRQAGKDQTILFLVSGGGSALFEKPAHRLPIRFLSDITSRLLLSGADISELNTVRKHLSSVKGGRFAVHCMPAAIFQITLSDVLGDRPDMIASGPAVPDPSTSGEALAVIKKYKIPLSPEIESALRSETPKSLDNVSFEIAGNVTGLCRAAKIAAEKRGYISEIVTDRLDGEARLAGYMAAERALDELGKSAEAKRCLIWGGETTVKVKGSGKGGRSQEVALAAAEKISGSGNIVILSAGSDGTDGPTDAAGGIVDGLTWGKIRSVSYDPVEMLENNDSYNALELAGALLKTGPTGTNVNDLVIALG